MNSTIPQKLAISLALATIVGISYYAYAQFLPRFEEQFISLSILGDEQSLGHYYPQDNPTIGVNMPIYWYLRLFNHTPEDQNLLIKVKVLNATQLSPNSTLCLPSPVLPVFELHTSLTNSESLIYPFFWSISSIEHVGEGIIIREMSANNMTARLNTYSSDGNEFRVVFELWIYDSPRAEYVFVQRAVTDRCVWNQIWFNIM